MKPWMKVAIGCFAVATIALFLFVAGVIGFGYWAKPVSYTHLTLPTSDLV